MFCFLKPSFLTGGGLATVISNVGEERKPELVFIYDLAH